MAIVITIPAPLVAAVVSPGVYSVSVTAHAVDGVTILGDQTFTTTTTVTSAAGRAQVAAELLNQIKDWRANLQLVQSAATVLGQIRTAIEAGLT